ncbi:MAG: hypothetical protein VX862_04530 [Pseudomonadota bacterium]|nr:hypothetical protein [Pseudomonadota bacterium]
MKLPSAALCSRRQRVIGRPYGVGCFFGMVSLVWRGRSTGLPEFTGVI